MEKVIDILSVFPVNIPKGAGLRMRRAYSHDQGLLVLDRVFMDRYKCFGYSGAMIFIPRGF